MRVRGHGGKVYTSSFVPLQHTSMSDIVLGANITKTYNVPNFSSVPQEPTA